MYFIQTSFLKTIGFIRFHFTSHALALVSQTFFYSFLHEHFSILLLLILRYTRSGSPTVRGGTISENTHPDGSIFGKTLQDGSIFDKTHANLLNSVITPSQRVLQLDLPLAALLGLE